MSEQEYLEYLENRSELTESVESYARHEELKERKNQILMLLNGDVEADDDEEEEEESIEVIGQLDGEVFDGSDQDDVLEIDAHFSP